MKKLFFLLFFSFELILPQSLNLNSPENIKLFADFLYCEKDYLRAIDEYEKYLSVITDDTVEFKIAVSYQQMNKYQPAKNKLEKLINSKMESAARNEYYKTIFLSADFPLLRSKYDKRFSTEEINKLYLLSYFFTDDPLPEKKYFSEVFSSEKVLHFYNLKNDPPLKSPAAAALLSVIPGLGKIYTDEIGDGITAFLATGVLAYLSYTNFKHDHDFRGWLFGGLGAVFYAGNIYGSAASAKIYNARIRFDFENNVKLFLEENNYFSPDYNFCR